MLLFLASLARVCEFCEQEFIARKTTSQSCSDPCAKRLYKFRQREKAIDRAEVETMVKRKPEAFITEEQVKAIQAKEWLTLKEEALVLDVWWTLAGKVRSEKVGRKHLFEKRSLNTLLM